MAGGFNLMDGVGWVETEAAKKFKLPTWMSQEVSKRLGSVGYNPNISHLQVGYNPFTNHLQTSWTS